MANNTCLCGVNVTKFAVIAALLNIAIQSVNLFFEVQDFLSAFIDRAYFNAMTKLLYLPMQNVKFNHSEEEDNSYTRAQRVFDNYYDSFLFCMLAAIGILTSLVLLVAICKRSPRYYIPFLLFVVVDLFILFVTGMLFLISSVVIYIKPARMEVNFDDAVQVSMAFLLSFLISAIVFVFQFYFMLIVVNRSRLRLIKEKNRPELC